MHQQTPNPVRRLDALVGSWEFTASVDGRPVGCGRTSFEWLEAGAFLVQYADAAPTEAAPPEWLANSPFPVTAVIGLDDTHEAFSMLYADARGVLRVYQMSLDGARWTLRRDAPGFFQRFTGTFSDAGTTISGRWERSPDGTTWKPDFETTYRRITAA